MIELERARSALETIDSGCSREKWVYIGMAIKAAGLSFEDFHNWSTNPTNYISEKDCQTTWQSFDESGGITEATLFHMAREAGWKDSSNNSNYNKAKPKQKNNIIKNALVNESSYAVKIWKICVPADEAYPYISTKQGIPDGLKVYPIEAPPLIIDGQNVAGYLVTPCISNGKIQTLQFIPPMGGEKLNLGGARFHDGYFIVGQITNCIFICEGLSAAWSTHKASGKASIVSFGAGRMMTVAKVLRSQYPFAQIVIVPDRGKEELALKIAVEVGAFWIELPQEEPINFDTGDYAHEYG